MGRLELSRIYRQTDEDFLSILNSVRVGNASQEILGLLNAHVRERAHLEGVDSYVTLTPRNDDVHQINMQRLAQLDTPEFEYQAEVSGKFEHDESSDPTERTLRLKQGARVIMLRSRPQIT